MDYSDLMVQRLAQEYGLSHEEVSHVLDNSDSLSEAREKLSSPSGCGEEYDV
jgi:hypothetical protein